MVNGRDPYFKGQEICKRDAHGIHWSICSLFAYHCPLFMLCPVLGAGNTMVTKIRPTSVSSQCRISRGTRLDGC